MKIEVGDLVKYMSRHVLVVDKDDDWVYGVELGETQVGKYRRSYLKKNGWKFSLEKEQ